MEELAVKKDFTNICTQKFPNACLQEMKRLDYRTADKTKPLYLSIAKQLCNKLSRKINILDIGSSYGINSALMKHDLDDFFLKQEPSIEQSKQFFEQLSSYDFDFYQIDVSEPALRFSENVNLCKKGICVNLESGNLPIAELPQSNMVIATGCIGYVGHKAFSNIFELIKKQNSEKDLENPTKGPVFTFSVLRMFDMTDIEKIFDHYGYSLSKTDNLPTVRDVFQIQKKNTRHCLFCMTKGLKQNGLKMTVIFMLIFTLEAPKNLNLV